MAHGTQGGGVVLYQFLLQVVGAACKLGPLIQCGQRQRGLPQRPVIQQQPEEPATAAELRVVCVVRILDVEDVVQVQHDELSFAEAHFLTRARGPQRLLGPSSRVVLLLGRIGPQGAVAGGLVGPLVLVLSVLLDGLLDQRELAPDLLLVVQPRGPGAVAVAVDAAVIALLAVGMALVAFAVPDSTGPAASFGPAPHRPLGRLLRGGRRAIHGGLVREDTRVWEVGELHLGKVGENVSAQRWPGEEGCRGR